MKTKRNEARVTTYFPPTKIQPSGRVEIACPYCHELDRYRRPTDVPGRHLHGIGAAGQVPDLGDRVSHCVSHLGRGYEIVDPDNLVPERLVIEQVTA